VSPRAAGEGARVELNAGRRSRDAGIELKAGALTRRALRAPSSPEGRGREIPAPYAAVAAVVEGAVVGAEKDPGFFAALRMTKEAAASRFLINAGYALAGRGDRTSDHFTLSG